MHEPYKPIKFRPSKIYSENPKKLNQSFNASSRLIKMAVPMAKIKQVFIVEKLNPQQEETIKSLLHLIKLNNKYTYWYYLSHREYKHDLHNIPYQHMLIPPCLFEKRASETEEQHAYITCYFIG